MSWQTTTCWTPRGGDRLADLLIAGTAEKAGLTVFAVDKDFDLIAAIMRQSIVMV